MQAFDYAKPASVDEAIALLDANEGAKLLAGGQTLVPTMKQGLAAPSLVVSLKGIAELATMRDSHGALEIGAMATHAAVAVDPIVHRLLPGLSRLAGGIGDRHVRNRGTIGGSIANCDPAADYPAALLALSAVIRTNQRDIDADDFFVGLFTTALDENEIVRSVLIPAHRKLSYRKFSNPASRYAIVGSAVTKTDDEVRVAVTGAGSDGVFRWFEAEEALAESFKRQALASLEPDHDLMMSDLHATGPYRAALVRVMAQRAVADLDLEA